VDDTQPTATSAHCCYYPQLLTEVRIWRSIIIPKIVVSTLVNAALSYVLPGIPIENESGCGVVGELGNKRIHADLSFTLGTKTTTKQDQRLHSTPL
jgi:hypothetical protein